MRRDRHRVVTGLKLRDAIETLVIRFDGLHLSSAVVGDGDGRVRNYRALCVKDRAANGAIHSGLRRNR